MKGRKKMEVSMYLRSLNPRNLINSIREMEKYFDMELIEDPTRVEVDCLKLKGHASLWWDNV